jgi:hypothetical protein
VHCVVFGREVCVNHGSVASVPWNRTVNNLLRTSVTDTTTFINLDISPYPKQPITSSLANLPAYTSPRAPPTSSCNNHSRIPSSHLQAYNPRNAAPGPGHLNTHTHIVSTASIHLPYTYISVFCRIPAFQRELPSTRSCTRWARRCGLPCPSCLHDVLVWMEREVGWEWHIPHLISPAVLQRREARLQGPGSLAVVGEVRDRRARRRVGTCICEGTLRT